MSVAEVSILTRLLLLRLAAKHERQLLDLCTRFLELGQLLGPLSSIWLGDIMGIRVKYKKFIADQVKGKWRFKDRMVNFPNLTLKYKKRLVSGWRNLD
jgi:hypothetical protein